MKSNLSAIIWGLFAVLIWSAIPAFVKIGSTADSLPFLLVCRFSIASLVFLPILKTILVRFNKIPKKLWLTLTIVLTANYYFQGLAMIDLPVSWYLIIFCLNPILALFTLKIKMTRKTWLAISFSIVGTLAFVNMEEILKMQSLLPFVFLILGMLTWVAYTFTIKKFQAVFSDVETTAITQFSSLIGCLLAFIFFGSKVSSLSVSQTAAIIALGLFTPLAYYGFSVCLRKLPKFGILSQYLEPVFGVLIGFVFFKEILSLQQIVGATLIVISTIALE